jgi:hypothetical protein
MENVHIKEITKIRNELSHSISQDTDSIKEFINRILPKKYREGKYIAERGRILINDEYVIPDTILQTDPLFASFRI